MKWSYGVTTVPARRDVLLPRTLASLIGTGFDRPYLFVDGSRDLLGWEKQFGLETTIRYPAMRPFLNWVSSLWELYARDPAADRYAIFQDDIVAVKGLRRYLEKTTTHAKAYWNLILYPSNRVHLQQQPGGITDGWHPSNQLGRGGQGLVFSREAVIILLGSPHMPERVQDAHRGWRSLDGAVVTAMKNAGWTEMIHHPSLLLHTGEFSSMGNRPQPPTVAFPGEDFNAMDLLKIEAVP